MSSHLKVIPSIIIQLARQDTAKAMRVTGFVRASKVTV